MISIALIFIYGFFFDSPEKFKKCTRINLLLWYRIIIVGILYIYYNNEFVTLYASYSKFWDRGYWLLVTMVRFKLCGYRCFNSKFTSIGFRFNFFDDFILNDLKTKKRRIPTWTRRLERSDRPHSARVLFSSSSLPDSTFSAYVFVLLRIWENFA